jgi:hypothetical protein
MELPGMRGSVQMTAASSNAQASSSSGASSSGQHAGEHQEKYVTVGEVQSMIQDTLRQVLPTPSTVPRKCSGCKQSKQKSGFSLTQWREEEESRKCLVCQPVEARFLKSVKDDKVCVQCSTDKKREDFTDTQWAKGSKSKCRECVAHGQLLEKRQTRKCVGPCGEVKALGDFSNSQLGLSLSVGKCRLCCQASKQSSNEKFSKLKRSGRADKGQACLGLTFGL